MEWGRQWSSYLSTSRQAGFGLSTGWTNSFDYSIEDPQDGRSLILVSPNGSRETLGYSYNFTARRYDFSTEKRAGYVVSGNFGPVSTSITLTHQDGTKFYFYRALGRDKTFIGSPRTRLYLTGIEDRNGQALTLDRDLNVADLGLVGRLNAIRNSNGDALLTLVYDASNLLSYVEDNQGRRVYYGFSAVTPEASIPAGNGLSEVQLSFVSQIVPSATPRSSAATLAAYGYTAYYGTPLLSSISVPHPNGTTSGGVPVLTKASVVYDVGGRVKTLIDANGNTRNYEYLVAVEGTGFNSVYSSRVTVKNAAGTTVSVNIKKHDIYGRLRGTQDSQGHTTQWVYGSYVYDTDTGAYYKPSQITDEMGRVSRFSYDKFGHVVASTTPRGVVTTATYDYSNFPLGRLASLQQSVTVSGVTASKPARTFTYEEPSGRLVAMSGPSADGSATVTTTLTYNALGDVTSVSTPGYAAGVYLTTSFDYTTDGTYTQTAQKGEPVRVIDPLAHETHLRYDARGNVVAAWDALGNRVDTAYNLADDVLTALFPATGQTGAGRGKSEAVYAYVGGPVLKRRQYDEAGTKVRENVWVYGKEGEVTGTSGWDETAATTYDAEYRVLSVADGNARKTSYAYNLDGDLTSVKAPTANSSTGYDVNTFTYAPDHQLQSAKDGRGITATYGYADPDGQLTGVSYDSGFSSDGATYSYDNWGRATGVVDGAGTRTMSYYTSDALQSVTRAFRREDGTLMSGKTLTSSYYLSGDRQKLSSAVGNFVFYYDAAGRMTRETNPQGVNTTWGYANNDWLLSQNTGGKVVAAYTYNALGQVLGVKNTTGSGASVPGVLLSQFGHDSDVSKQLRYDGVGNLLRRLANVPGVASASGTWNYLYDGKDQLKSESATSSSGAVAGSLPYLWAWSSYDGAGNATGQSYTDASNTTTGVTRTFNTSNQETTLTLQGAVQYAYDGEGNPTQHRGLAAAYDARSRLKSLQIGTGPSASTLLCGYDSDGLRAWKALKAPSGVVGPRTYYLYDGQTLLGEFDSQGRATAANTWGVSGLVSRLTTSYPNPTGTTGAVSTTTLYAFDECGNVAQRLDTSGVVQSQSAYNATGTVIAQSGNADVYGFGGQSGYYRDAESGLLLCTHRFYDTGNARWLNRDPIGFSGGINLYNYVGNNFVNEIDPDGLAPSPMGHHIIPQRLWSNATQSVKEVFDSARFRIANRLYNIHDASRYAGITEPAYRRAVEQRLESYLSEVGKTCVRDLTTTEAEDFANRILFTQDGIIGLYNSAVRRQMANLVARRILAGGANITARRGGFIAGEVLAGTVGGVLKFASGPPGWIVQFMNGMAKPAQ